jgi:uncharacterized protein YggE
MKQFILILLCTLFMAPSYAQETVKGEHFIEVSGSAETEIEPNEIVLFVRLKEFEDNKQKVSLDKIDASFLEAVKAAGIDSKKLVLAGGGAVLEKIGKRDSDSFREKSYQITISSASELEKFIAKLENVKVNQVHISRLDHTDKEKLKLELKVKALQAAKSKAETLLKSIGGEIGKPIMVREIDFGPVQPYGRMDMVSNVAMDAGPGYAEQPLGFKKIKFREQVTAQFEIK